MTSTDLAAKINHLADAGVAYPWNFTFRTAQAMQMFDLARRNPSAVAPAEFLLAHALRVYPGSVEIASKLYGAQMALGKCDEAKATGEVMMRLAPRSSVVQRLVATPCGDQ